MRPRIGVGAGLVLIPVTDFAFWRGLSIKPDRHRRIEDWIRITWFGSSG